ncbi:hypothetical protein IU500_34435 [Nocardia terpenica]|uniref:hypothetical protein n=1 Tax=Nocardia terpenica TaxID=455432 RepID=UPI001896136A|nr:hypothetical protein [Nocardia terpenica]MBF6065433.1 hypothetical protein [Nocardia terpenica]MBF6109115.1 hypothetical protein [Nocardia terpenica]MBF6114683.1 hypothetical protein [Nocardia terpenica]MBF6123368.1 hypothetical protein [Nocardia terpenica]MBF6156614.1 hypothetical protein [Nocardia terpenica]
MERERENTMRAAFAEFAAVRRQARQAPAGTDAESGLLRRAHAIKGRCLHELVDPRWGFEWSYLDSAYHDWRREPDSLRRFLGVLEEERARGGDGGLTAIQLRSQQQARDLVEAERTHSRTWPQRSR